MNFLEAQNQVLEDTNDNSAENRARVKIWLNRSMRRILASNRTWSFLIKEEEATLTASNELDLIEDFRWLFHAVDVTRKNVLRPLPRLIFEDMHYDRTTTGTIRDYTLISERADATSPLTYKVLFDNVDTTDLRYIYYIKVEDLVNDDNIPPWEAEWDWVWISGAMYYAYKFLDRPEEVSLEIREFLKGVARMKAHDSANVTERLILPLKNRFNFRGRILYPPEARFIFGFE